MDDVVLTKQEAIAFLQNVLKITDPETEQSQKSKLDFLRLIIRQWFEFVPFQNVNQLYLTKTENRLPTVEEIVALQMAGKGGVCLHLAIFCQLLLKALDFNAYLTVANIIRRHDHAIVIANDISEKGDQFLIDVGCGYPTFEPIPIESIGNFDSSPVYHHSSLEYKFVKEGGFITRYHRRGDLVLRKGNYVFKDGWRRHSEVESMKPVTIRYLYSKEQNIFNTLIVPTPNSLLLRFVFAARYPKGYSYGIKYDGVSVTADDGERTTTPLAGEAEMKSAFEEFFPMVDSDLIGEALDFAESNFKQWPDPL